MAESNTFKKVAEKIAEYRDIDVASITGETGFDSLGLDSLDIVELVMELEEEFGITIEVNEGLRTIGDVADMIDSLTGRGE